MVLSTDRLFELLEKAKTSGRLTASDREYIHDAYWNGSRNHSDLSLEILSYVATGSDLPILLDASSPTTWWVNRCKVVEALGRLTKEGPPALRVMRERELNPCVKFWIDRELIDFQDESVDPFLNGPIPAPNSFYRRSVWIYGNFESGRLHSDRAMKLLQPLLADPRRRASWLKDHILEQSTV